MKNLQMLTYLPFSVRNVESPDDVKTTNALPVFEIARAAEREEAMENLENFNAYLVLKMNNCIKH